MTTRRRWIAGVASSMVVGIVISAGGVAAQVPPVDSPPSSVPTTPAPPGGQPAPTPAPSEPPEGIAPDGPGTPAPAPDTPVTSGPPAPASPKTPPPTTGADASGALKPMEKVAPARFTLDFSELEALRREARGKGPRAAIPDHGFDPSLPFQKGAGHSLGAPLDDVRELGAEEEQIARVREAGSVAAGLIALLLVSLATYVLRQAQSAVLTVQH